MVNYHSWKTLKLPLFTILTLLNTYTRFQYTLPILEYDARDIKRVNKLVQWAISNDSSAFVPTKRYNPFYSIHNYFLLLLLLLLLLELVVVNITGEDDEAFTVGLLFGK